MTIVRTVAAGLLAGGLMMGSAAWSQQAQPAAPITTATSETKTAGPVTWTNEQLMSASVHDAWVMSGKNEATFFEMVTQLADVSARKRSLQLPESKEAGRKFGELIKSMAKADTDQLLYVVVDKAVQQVGVPLKS